MSKQTSLFFPNRQEWAQKNNKARITDIISHVRLCNKTRKKANDELFEELVERIDAMEGGKE